MAGKGIRLQYTGYIIFAAKIISIATGLAFQFMVARLATTQEYDIFFNLSDVLAYFTLMAGVVPFWVMRCVARGKPGATKTGFATNLVFSFVSTLAYIGILPFILPVLLSGLGISNWTAYLPLYLIVSLQITELYLIGLFESCLQAATPQKIGFGLLIQQIFKLALGYVLIVQFGQPLVGAITATIAAFALQAIYYFKLTASDLKASIHWSYVKDWLKGSILNIYSVVGSQIAAFVFILLFSLGGEGSRGIYGAANQIANVVTYASFLAFALYPKLLAERKNEDVTSSFKTVMMFALPMTVGAIALANSYIVLLRVELIAYPGAAFVLIVLALNALINVLSGIYGSVLFGVETVDQETMSVKSLAKSKLFKYYSLSYISSAIAIPTTYFALTTFAYQQPLAAALSVCTITTMANFVIFLALVVMVQRSFKVVVPWTALGRYLLASVIMGVVLYLLPYSDSISTTLIWTAIGGAVYLGILMLIDKEARALPKSILGELVRKKKT